MLLREMQAYHPGVNVDRLVAFSALISFAKVQQSNRGYSRRVDNESGIILDNPGKLHKLNMSPFRHIGGSNTTMSKLKRSPFRNFK